MNGWFFSFLTLAVIFIVIANVFLLKVWETGKRARFHTSRGLENHRLWVNRYLWMTLFLVVSIELMVKSHRGLDEGVTRLFDTPLGLLHAGLDLTYILSLIFMRLFFTGLKTPRLHRFLFKVVFLSYLSIIVTGAILTVRLVG